MDRDQQPLPQLPAPVAGIDEDIGHMGDIRPITHHPGKPDLPTTPAPFAPFAVVDMVEPEIDRIGDRSLQPVPRDTGVPIGRGQEVEYIVGVKPRRIAGQV